jgi:hypothetical protein
MNCCRKRTDDISVIQLVSHISQLFVEDRTAGNEINIPRIVGQGLLDAVGKGAFAYDFRCYENAVDELAESLHHFM